MTTSHPANVLEVFEQGDLKFELLQDGGIRPYGKVTRADGKGDPAWMPGTYIGPLDAIPIGYSFDVRRKLEDHRRLCGVSAPGALTTDAPKTPPPSVTRSKHELVADLLATLATFRLAHRSDRGRYRPRPQEGREARQQRTLGGEREALRLLEES